MCYNVLIKFIEEGGVEMFGGSWGFVDILIIILVVLGALVAGLYFLNSWASKKMTQQQDIIAKTKQTVKIYVIDKKRDKPQNMTSLPKAIMQNLPKTSKLMNMNFVKAKVGPQIMTLMCDKHIFNYLTLKKDFHVEVSGIYIASVKGMKSKHQIKQEEKAKRNKEKMAKRIEKATK